MLYKFICAYSELNGCSDVYEGCSLEFCCRPLLVLTLSLMLKILLGYLSDYTWKLLWTLATVNALTPGINLLARDCGFKFRSI
jgi:hypothetical protein